MKIVRIFCLVFVLALCGGGLCGGGFGLCAESVPMQWEDLKAFAQGDSTLPQVAGKLFGFVVPLERDNANALTEFLLVPYFGACIHVPPPPPDQIVHVFVDKGVFDIETMDTVWVEGLLVLDTRSGSPSFQIEHAKVIQTKGIAWTKMLYAFVVTFVCGGSLALGFIGPFSRMQVSNTVLCWSMSIASGMLIGLGGAVLIFARSQANVLAFCCGCLICFFLGKCMHAKKQSCFQSVAFGLALHNYPECFLVCSLAIADSAMGMALALAMLAHNVPLAISLGLGSKRGSLRGAFVAAFIPPLLAVFTYYHVRAFVSTEGMRLVMAGAGGVLFVLALFFLLPYAKEFGKTRSVAGGVLLGLLFLLLVMGVFSYCIQAN